MKTLRVLVLLAILSGCDMEARRYERLQGEVERAEASVQLYETRIDAALGFPAMQALREDLENDLRAMTYGQRLAQADIARLDEQSRRRMADIRALEARQKDPAVVAEVEALSAKLDEAIARREEALAALAEFLE